MKNILYKILLITGVIFTSSCEDYLTEDPETDFFADQIFANDAAAETAVTGMYIEFSSFDYHGSGALNLLMPLSGMFWSSQTANVDATSLNCTPSNINLNSLWSGMYRTINTSNTVIFNINNSTAVLNNKDWYLGQAHLLRAITYFDMVRIWGGVPIKTEPATSYDLHTPRSTREEVYDLIISDLEIAKQLLPNIGEYNSSRPAKPVANAYLAKVYMTLATLDDANNLQMWQNAYDEAIQVYGLYSLETTYEALFDIENENNSESMFEIQYTTVGGRRSSDAIRMFEPSAITDQTTFGRIRPNKEIFDQHVNQYTEEDPRIDATFYYGSYTKINGANQNLYPTITNNANGFTAIKKYQDPYYNGTTSERNYYKLRYADVLLMLAEITNELDGPTIEAYGYVNEVLARARHTEDGNTVEPADWHDMSQAEFRMRIMYERQYELLAEGHAWYDTRRRGYEYFLQEIIENHNNQPNLGNRDYIYPISVKNMLAPIPSDEINNNYEISEADQNPGY